MNENEAKKRIEKLRKEIDDLRYRYHVLNDPRVTDEVYTSLMHELAELEEKFPKFKSSLSPTVRIGGKPLEKFKKIRHATPMLSLNDCFSYDELQAWEKRLKKILPDKKWHYFCELKFDGLAISIVYKDGIFDHAATRGDGLIGEDVSENVKTIGSVPLKIESTLLVRGEVVMRKLTLEELNKKQKKAGLPLFANTRNAAAGSLRQLDPKLASIRKLDFFAFDIDQGGPASFMRHSAEHEELRRLGFKLGPEERICKNLPEVFAFIEKVKELREKLPFGIDGVVISVNENDLAAIAGVVGKAPRAMAAFKYPPEKATTVIKDIKMSVGRTGVLTPVAIFKPTLVAGSTVSKATLHNMDQIERLDVRIGDTVVIQKAGDVIPEVVEVIKKLRTDEEKKFHMPKRCPVCGGRVEKKTSLSAGKASVAYYCTNPKCPAKNRRGMQHFVNVLEIYEVGPKILDRFSDEGLISDVADLFALKQEDIAGLERFGERSAENIISSIQDHKKVPLSKFLYALGILHVGEETAQDMARVFGTLEKIMKASKEEINGIENIGPVVSQSVYDFFQDERNIVFIKKFLKNGIMILPEKEIKGKLKGKIFVLTGILDKMSREEAKKKITALGGRSSETVTKDSILIVGAEPGSKLAKARVLGAKVIDEKEFLGII